MARPTKYLKSKHPIEFVQLSQNGHTKAEICAKWGISRETLNQWSKDANKPEFSDAIKRGREALEACFCEKFKTMAISGATPGGLGALIWLSKNCLNWGDKEAQSKEPVVVQLKYAINDRNNAPAT